MARKKVSQMRFRRHQEGRKRNDLQRYECLLRGWRFQNVRQLERKHSTLWNQYVWGKQTLDQLSKKHGIDIKTVQKRLDATKLKREPISSQPLVLIADVSFFLRGDGALVVRSPKLKRNIFWSFVNGENPLIYRDARKTLESEGFVIFGRRLGWQKGRQGGVFRHTRPDVSLPSETGPETISHLETETRSGTRTPGTRKDSSLLKRRWLHTTAREMVPSMGGFPERTDVRRCWGNISITHKKIRSAYRSLKNNLPYLFTFQQYPKLHMPNTTNSLDGYFSQMKKLLRVHNGLSEERR